MAFEKKLQLSPPLLQALKSMSKHCNFRQVTSVEYRNEAVRDTFIRGLLNGNI